MSTPREKLVVTRMDGPDDSSPATLENPRWADIESAVRRLDGKTCTLLILGIGPPPVPHMAIGGGDEGKFIVYSTPDNLVFCNLLNPEAPGGKLSIVAGSQLGEYDLKNCVDLTTALRAAKTYAESGRNDSALRWERQC